MNCAMGRLVGQTGSLAPRAGFAWFWEVPNPSGGHKRPQKAIHPVQGLGLHALGAADDLRQIPLDRGVTLGD